MIPSQSVGFGMLQTIYSGSEKEGFCSTLKAGMNNSPMKADEMFLTKSGILY